MLLALPVLEVLLNAPVKHLGNTMTKSWLVGCPVFCKQWIGWTQFL